MSNRETRESAFAYPRLKQLREKCGFSIPECALLLGTELERYRNIEEGAVQPSCEEIRILANVLGASTDYLLWMDEKEDTEQLLAVLKDLDTDNFAIRLTRLMAYAGEDVKDIATLCKKKTASVYYWRRGRSVPDVKTLMLLAEHYDCSTDYLLGFSKQKKGS